jgi:hypothetical protein
VMAHYALYVRRTAQPPNERARQQAASEPGAPARQIMPACYAGTTLTLLVHVVHWPFHAVSLRLSVKVHW